MYYNFKDVGSMCKLQTVRNSPKVMNGFRSRLSKQKYIELSNVKAY